MMKKDKVYQFPTSTPELKVNVKSEEYWEGFDYALAILDSMYSSTHPHPLNICDCVKAKVNRLKKNKIRKNNMNEIPRRNRLDLFEPAEQEIYSAMGEVEKLGADERLTNAIIHLSKAKDLVSDYIDEQKK